MVKKQAKRARVTSQQLKSALSRGGEVLKTVLGSHPAVVGFTIMAAATVAQIIIKPYENKGEQWAKDTNFQLGGLYAGVQGTIVALAAAPVIAQGIGLATSAMKQSTTKSEVPVPP